MNRVRRWCNEHAAIMTVAALGVILLAMAMMVSREDSPVRPRVGQTDAYYYDTVTGQYFRASIHLLPPIRTPDNHEAVRARFFTCGQCNDEEVFLGYYEKMTEQAKEAVKASRLVEEGPQRIIAEEEARRVAAAGMRFSVDGEQWVPTGVNERFVFSERLNERCGEPGLLKYCPPDTHRPVALVEPPVAYR